MNKLTILLNITKSVELSSPLVRSLQEAVQYEMSNHIRIILLVDSPMLGNLDRCGLRSFKDLEFLIHIKYDGMSLYDCDRLHATREIGKIFEDDPITYLEHWQILNLSSLKYLTTDLWNPSSFQILLSPFASLYTRNTPFRINEMAYERMSNKIDFDIFAVLRDLVLGLGSIVWVGSISDQVFQETLSSVQNYNSDPKTQWLVFQWLLLTKRVRLANLMLIINTNHNATAQRQSLSKHKNRLRVCIDILAENNSQPLFSHMLSIVRLFNESISVYDHDDISDLQNHPLNSFNHRTLIASEIYTVFGAENHKNLLSHDFNLPLLQAHHPYIVSSPSRGIGLDLHASKDLCNKLSEILDPNLSTLLAKLEPANHADPPLRSGNVYEITNIHPTNSLLVVPWFKLSELISESEGEHALVFTQAANKDDCISISFFAAKASLTQVTLNIAKGFLSEEVRININLMDGSYAIVSGSAVNVNVVVIDVGVCWCELEVVANYSRTSKVSLRICNASKSYYRPTGMGSILLAGIDIRQNDNIHVRYDNQPNLWELYRSTQIPASDSDCNGLPKLFLARDISQHEQAHSLLIPFASNNTSTIQIEVSTLSRLEPVSVEQGERSIGIPPSNFEMISNSDAINSCFFVSNVANLVASPGIFVNFGYRVSPPFLSHQYLIIKQVCLIRSGVDLSIQDGSPIRAADDGSPTHLVTAVGVAFGMHEFVPEWLNNYAMQTIHHLCCSQLCIADIDLSLPLLIYVNSFKFYSGLDIRIVPILEDPGLYECWNSLIKQSSSRYVTNFNPDDRKLPDHLAALCYLLERHQVDIAASSCYVLRYEGGAITSDIDEIQRLSETWWGDGKSPGLLCVSTKDLIRQISPSTIMPGNRLHSMPVWRKRLHERVGFFNESEHGTYADFALWIEALNSGCSAIFLNVPLYMFAVVKTSHNRVNANQEKLNLLMRLCGDS